MPSGYRSPVSSRLDIRRLAADDIGLLSQIDRSEQLDVRYTVESNSLVSHAVDIAVPGWQQSGDGEHSVNRMITAWQPIVAQGAVLLGAFVGDALHGLAIVDAEFEPEVAWLALLYVTRRHRRAGVAAALWSAAEQAARAAGAKAMYVSSAPSGSAVGFYTSRGCRLAAPAEINAGLFDLEPDDVHLICPIAASDGDDGPASA